jgi:hypothetical protein
MMHSAASPSSLIAPVSLSVKSMWRYLLASAQTRQLNQISTYAEGSSSREQSRLLYMNAGALRIWREMGMVAMVIGESCRPARSALLCFGMRPNCGCEARRRPRARVRFSHRGNYEAKRIY